jgi:16S rRNA (cytosine967-C5)-methyltransferase
MSTKRRASHATSSATPARKAAFELVSRTREQEVYLSSIAEEVLKPYALDPSDKAFARLIAQGAISLQTTLDALIDRSLRSPRDIKADVRDALRISAYEILYLRKEEHAAVDQGVELVRHFAPRATGVANYVLHRIVEEKERFPYGDPRESLDAAALFYGFPQWLARAVKKDIGTRNALAFMAESIEAAPVWFTNTTGISHDDLAHVLDKTGIEYDTCRPIASAFEDEDSIFQLAHRGDVGEAGFATLLRDDRIVVSDLSAQSIVARAVSVLPATDGRLLEIGAGRGTKSLLLQSACERKGVRLCVHDAMDISAKKLRALKNRIEAAGGNITSTIAHDALKAVELSNAPYDLVFIDAPCTGIGTLRRHPEIKGRLKQDDSRALAKMGQAMLEHAAAQVAPQGYLLYATCTVFKEENDKVIMRFLASAKGKGFEVVPIGAKGTPFFKTPLVTNGPDLHFACLLQCK